MNSLSIENNSSNVFDHSVTDKINDVTMTMTSDSNNSNNMALSSAVGFDRPTKKIRQGKAGDGSVSVDTTDGNTTNVTTAPPAIITRTNTIDSVFVLTEIGIANYNRGHHSKAQQFFSQALRRVVVAGKDDLLSQVPSVTSLTTTYNDNDKLSQLRRESADTSSLMIAQQQLLHQYTETDQNDDQLMDMEHDDSNNDTSATNATTTSTTRTTEYDEGMHVYQSPLAVTFAAQTPVHKHQEHRDITSTLYYNMGQINIRQGLYQDATMWFLRALELLSLVTANDRSLSSPSSSQSLIIKTLHCLGYCCYRNGDEASAMTYYQRALDLVVHLGSYERTSCTTNVTTYLAAALNCVGVLHFNKQTNTTDLAMKMFVESLNLYQSSYNDNQDSNDRHNTVRSIATVMNNIGRVHYLRSDFDQALTAYQKSLELRRQVLGQDSMDVAATVYNIGQTYHQLHRLDESMEHYKEFIRIATSEDQSVSSKDLGLVYKGIAEIYQEQANLEQARNYFIKALEAQQSTEEMSCDVATILNKLGNLCYEMRDFNAAMKHYRHGLDVERNVLPPNHPHTIITLTNISHIHKQMGEYSNALIAYQAVGKMQVVAFGSESLNVAETLSSVGLMQYHLRDYESSFESYQEALRIRRQCYGTDEHPDIASTLNSVGLVLFKQDLFDLAKQCFMESLRIRTKLLGKDHRDVAILWYNIATIYFETGEDERAIEMYKETLRVERKALGHNHSDVVLTLQHLGQVHQQLGQIEEALRYFEEALNIERNREDSNKKDSSVGRILNLIGNVYLQLGKTEEMMKCYIEASRIYESNTSVQETLVIAGYNHYGLSKTNPPCASVA